MPGIDSRNSYLRTKVKVKLPVGKVAGVDSHTYNGSHLMHVLVEHLRDVNGQTVSEWRLRCKPSKNGVYSYMGFREAVTCKSCKAGRVFGSDDS